MNKSANAPAARSFLANNPDGVGLLRLGVAGAGAFGRNHIKKIIGATGASLVGVHDLGHLHLSQVEDMFLTRGFSELGALLDRIDALIVAVPAVAHFQVASAALARGIPCLVEKPVTATKAEADALLTLAAAHSTFVQVGHQERYVFRAMGLLDTLEKPRHVEAVRAGLPSIRGSDVSVTFDLMVHDLDLVLQLYGGLPTTVSATHLAGVKGQPTAVEALLTWADGRTAKFLASKAAEERARTMRADYEGGSLDIDFLTRKFVDGAGLGLHADFAERLKDPMAASTADFIAAARGEGPVFVTGQAGADAVALAEWIDRASAEN